MQTYKELINENEKLKERLQILLNEKKNNGIKVEEQKEKKRDFCNNYISVICCLSSDDTIIVFENDHEVVKPVTDIKIGDLVVTYSNGKKIYSKVNFWNKYDGNFKFYEFKINTTKSIKTIKVTYNHVMMCYDKDMNLRYKTAEEVTLNDYFYTNEGLFKISEIKTLDLETKYACCCEDGGILVSDIMVTGYNINDKRKKIILDEILSEYKLKHNII